MVMRAIDLKRVNTKNWGCGGNRPVPTCRASRHPRSDQHRRRLDGPQGQALRAALSAPVLTAAAHPPELRCAPGRKNASAPNQRTGLGKRRERYKSIAIARRCPTIAPICARCYEAKSGVGTRGSVAAGHRRHCRDAPKAAPARAQRVRAARTAAWRAMAVPWPSAQT